MSAESHATNGKPIESVWDYPRPPRIERVEWRIKVRHAMETIVDAPNAIRVLETSQPPAYYVDPAHVRTELLTPSASSSFCEWKGMATYVDLTIGGNRVAEAAWRYDIPSAGFEDLAGFYAFYAQRLDACHIDDEQVDGNDGRFYGGWITSNVTGPFKGGPGTSHW